MRQNVQALPSTPSLFLTGSTLLSVALEHPWAQVERQEVEQALRQALLAHRWALAHLVLIKGVPVAQRRAWVETFQATLNLSDPLAQRMVGVVLGKATVERAQENWTVAPMNNERYFDALTPYYARFVALMAVGDGAFSWAQRRWWLNEAVAQGLPVHDPDLARALDLEAVRCPHPEVWGWLHQHGLLNVAPLHRVVRDALSERVSSMLPMVERLLASVAGSSSTGLSMNGTGVVG